MANHLKREKQIAVVSALVEGVSVNSTVRMTGVAKTTILRLIRSLGPVCADYHDRHVRGLKPERVETDEIWSFIGAKSKHVRPEREIEGWGDAWTWTAITEKKLIISYHLGLRTNEDAHLFMQDLTGRITNRTQLSTDGHLTYYRAVRRNFGSDVHYGEVVKMFGSPLPEAIRTTEAKYSPPRINAIQRTVVIGDPDPAYISTSCIERHNLTIRMSMRRFTRLTNAHSKKLAHHRAAIHMAFFHYNFCRVHSTMKTSPAVASGLADHVWSIEEMIQLAD